MLEIFVGNDDNDDVTTTMPMTMMTIIMMTSAPPTPDISVAEGLFNLAGAPVVNISLSQS